MALQFTPPKTPNMLQLLKGTQPQAASALPMPYPDVPQGTPPPMQADAGPAPASVQQAGTPPSPLAQHAALQAPAGPPESAQLSSQLQKMNAPPTARDALLKAVMAFAPTAIAGKFGGLPAAAGAAQGVNTELSTQEAEERQQKKDLLTQVSAARGREERMAERQLTTQERASEAELRRREIEGTNASRLEGLRGTNQTRADIQDLKNTLTTRGQDATLGMKGFLRDPISGEIKRTPEGQAKDRAELEYKQALTDHQEAMADAERERGNPSSPRFKQAQDRLNATAQRLSLSRQQFEMRAFGTNNGEALPGSMIGNDGKPVGSAFQQNVRPTGVERNKADMASSAREQLSDIVSIVERHPEVFGPVNGRTTELTNWIGSEDPDAKAFKAARSIAADHLAGTFGGRSEPALAALDDAIGQYKDNPAAMLAGIQQMDKAAKIFEDRGRVNTTGSQGGKALDDAKAAEYLKKAGGDKTKARALARADGYTF